jgi:PIN domain nuclease of toxin-antitoxin system
VRLLLDTHLLLWALGNPARLPAEARKALESSDVWVSAASIWEISIKSALGKVAADPATVVRAVEPAGFNFLSISADHAARVTDLPRVHKDPFDRMLVAQALTESLSLLTNDKALAKYGPAVRVV